MKHIRTYDSYKTVKSSLSSVDATAFGEAIKESVLQVGDVYKVRSMVDIPQSLINSYVKKVKDTTGKNLRQFFGDVEIAEQLLQYITTTGLDLDKIPGGALMGQAQTQSQAQTAPAAAQTAQGSDVSEEPSGGDFEEPSTAQTAQETPQATQETPQATQETPQATQETPQATQETPQEEEEEEEEETGEEELPV